MQTNQSETLLFIILAAIIFFIVLAIMVVIIIVIYQQKKLSHFNERKLMQASFKEELLNTKIEIQEQTLKTIAQEIHDNIGQILSLAKLNLNTFPISSNEVIQTKVNDTKQLVGKAIVDLRDLSRSLHGEKFADIGLEEAIKNELKNLQNTGQYQTHLTVQGHPYKIEPQKEIMLFRIVQEAIHNSVKHAKANLINVELKYEPSAQILTVTDDGIGFNPIDLTAAQTGIGLKNMKNRAALIGATLILNSAANNGTEINIELKR